VVALFIIRPSTKCHHGDEGIHFNLFIMGYNRIIWPHHYHQRDHITILGRNLTTGKKTTISSSAPDKEHDELVGKLILIIISYRCPFAALALTYLFLACISRLNSGPQITDSCRIF